MVDRCSAGFRVTREWVKCGKKNCKKCNGEGTLHGPYFYLYGRRQRKRARVYLGTRLRWPFTRFDAPVGLDQNPEA
jgi:Family of unknown function (DUF6788)